MAPSARAATALAALLAALSSTWQLCVVASTPATTPSSSWAAVNRDLSVSYAASPGFSRCSPAQDALFPRPVLLRDYDPRSPLTCTSQSVVESSAQPAKTASVLVALSKCLQDATIAAVASWAASKLQGDGGGTKVVAMDGAQDSKLAFIFALVDAGCASASSGNAAMSASRLTAFKKLGTIANSLSEAISGNGKAMTAFAAVISFVENAAAYSAVDKYESSAGVATAFNFAVCEGSSVSCESATARATAAATFPNANYLAQTSQLKDVDVFPSTPRFSCSQVLPNGTPAVIGDRSSSKCTCVCPRGYALASNNDRCDAVSSSSAATQTVGCAWDSYGTFQHQVTETDGSAALTNAATAWGLPSPVLERSRSTGTDPGQVVISCTRKGDPPVYDARVVSDAVARRSSSSTVIPLMIPSWAKTAAREFGNPIAASSRSASASVRSSTVTWRQYETSGSAAVNQSMSLQGFGVYELQVRATRADAQQVSCVGCLAVTDHFRPRGATACPSAYCDVETCDDDGIAVAVLTISNLYSAREAVAGVATFQLNASNDDYSNSRCDDMKIRTRTFHSANATAEMATIHDADAFHAQSDACFSTDEFWSDLLVPESPASNFSALFDDDAVLQSPVPVSKQCMRCCWLSVQLRESWIDYRCDAEFATQTCDGLDSEPSQCSLSQCLRVDPSVLLAATVLVREEARLESERVLTQLALDASQFQSVTQIHRAVACDNLDGSILCSFRTELSELLSLDVSFAPEFQDELLSVQLPSYNSYGAATIVSPNAADGVAWRFRVSGASEATWRRLDALEEEEIAFLQSATTITFEAWAPCGKVSQQSVSVYLHLTGQARYGGEPDEPDGPYQVCERFDSLWYQTSVLQPLVTDTLCNYPGSDFVELTFDFPGAASSSREHALPALPVTAIACFASFDAVPDAEPETAAETQILSVEGVASASVVVRRFAVELRRDPQTEFLTSLHVRCDFTLAARHGAPTVQSCSRSFVLASCEGPGVLANGCADGEALACVLGKCAAGRLPGPFEACGGTILRSDAAGIAVVAEGDGECCQACGRRTRCVSLLHVPSGEQDVRRCELQPLAAAAGRSDNAVEDSGDDIEPAKGYAAVLSARWRRSAGAHGSHDAPMTVAVLVLALAVAAVGAAALRRRREGSEDARNGYELMRG